MFYEKGVLKNIAKFTGKHLCQTRFFIKLQRIFNLPLGEGAYLTKGFQPVHQQKELAGALNVQAEPTDLLYVNSKDFIQNGKI